jgi:hypothetical protein
VRLRRSHGASGDAERRVVTQDLLLELLQLWPGIEAEFVGQLVRTRW